MRSKTVSLKIPWRLWEAYEKLAPKCDYLDAAQLLIWNPFYALMVNAKHSLTAPISKLNPEAQDAVIERVVSAWEKGEFAHGSFLERTLADIVKDFDLPVKPEVIETLVSDAVRRRKQK